MGSLQMDIERVLLRSDAEKDIAKQNKTASERFRPTKLYRWCNGYQTVGLH